MGLFDELRCHYPLPLAGANSKVYQTKDLVCYMDHYEIHEDGSLWHEEYDIEDQSDPNASDPFDRLAGCMTRINKRWEATRFLGEIRFYDFASQPGNLGWIEWSAYFVDGKLQQLHLARHEEAQDADAVDPSAVSHTGTPPTRA